MSDAERISSACFNEAIDEIWGEGVSVRPGAKLWFKLPDGFKAIHMEVEDADPQVITIQMAETDQD